MKNVVIMILSVHSTSDIYTSGPQGGSSTRIFKVNKQ